MWLVVGLGNPGARYSRTRHNAGFLVAESFAAAHGLDFREKAEYRICDGSIDGDRVVVMEPLTFMNRSGLAVKKVVGKYNIPPERVIVIHDDLDMDTGRLKIRRKGSSGGHKGVESVIEFIGSRDFVRVKIGIGRDEAMPVEAYVLSKFRREELPLIRESVGLAAESIGVIISAGVDKAMNRYN